MIKPTDNFFLLKQNNIEIFKLKGAEAKPFVDIIANFRLVLFKGFPYLYDGTIEGERDYLNIYFNCEYSTILLAYDKDDCIGFASAIPLIYEDEVLIKPLIKNSIDIKKYLYIGEGILLPKYQNIGIAKKFLKVFEEDALKNNLTSTIVAAVYREDNHKSKPECYTPISIILSKLGYNQMKGISSIFSWKSSLNGDITDNTMLYYSKDLNA